MKIYGLTGGTGSGKSTAAKRFAEHGIPVIDADQVGHDVIAPGGAAEEAVRNEFGESVLACGRIDRVKLGALVFADRAALERLNALVHPAITAEIARRCAAFAAAGEDAVVIDAALLGDRGVREPWLDGLILIACGRAERVRQLVLSKGMTPEEANRRIDMQVSPESKRALADWVIENMSTVAELHRRVDAIIERIHAAS